MGCNSQLYINTGIRIGVKREMRSPCHNECALLLLISNFISFTGHRPTKMGWARTGLIDPYRVPPSLYPFPTSKRE